MTPTDQPFGESGLGLAREVLIHGPIARSELGRRLGLSPASLTRLSKPFLDRGLFIEAPERLDGAVGRPAKPLDVRVGAQRFVGIKLTGDRAFGVITDLRANTLASASTPLSGHEPSVVVDAIETVVGELTSTAGEPLPTAIGVSVGGKVTGSRIVARAPFLDWRDVDLGHAIEARLGLPATIENDVVALTEAEHWFGLARGASDFAVITIGAGVGYGLVVHGRQMTTADTGLGLGGHFPLDPAGPLCADGHRGCSTAMLSTWSMCATAGVGLGREVGYEELLTLAIKGNPVAAQVVDAAGRALGRLIAAAANLAMVGTVVLSGEGIALATAAAAPIQAAIAADRDPDAEPVRILIDDPDFGAWARGAAAVAIQSAFGRLEAVAERPVATLER